MEFDYTDLDGGWVTWRSPVDGLEVRVRSEVLDGRAHVCEMQLTAASGLNSEHLRMVPLGRIEAALNAPVGARERAGLNLQPALVHDLRERKVPIQPVLAPGSVAVEPPQVWNVRPDDLRVLREGGESRSYPDSFYAEVATVYSQLAANSRRPAADLAEANGVPTTTAHRWIKEARRRGHLGPGRRGSAG